MPFFRRRKQEGVPADRSFGDSRAATLIEAVEADDLDRAAAVLTEPAAPEVRERLTAVLSSVSEHAGLFDAWVEREPDRADAWLARGAHGIGWAWDARGGDYAENTPQEAFEMFFDRLRRAEESLLRAADLAPQDPLPWTHMVISGRGLQVPKEELWLRYEEVQSRHPWLLEAHLQMLQGLCKKWSGSDEESLEFARNSMRDAPEGSPIAALVAVAHLEVWLQDDTDERYMRRDEVREEVHEAARRSVFAGGFTDDLVTVPATNIFAVALFLAGEQDAARELVSRLGRRRSEFPWYYLADGDGAYAELLGG